MAATSDIAPLVVIVGETGSGKSSLAIELAKQFNGEIICADSRTIYKGMDIGTAKPSAKQQALVPHHMLDIVEPDQNFSASEFQSRTRTIIEDIRSRGGVPFLVGGTGLYIDAVIFDYEFSEPPDPTLRQRLQSMTISELHDEITRQGITMPANDRNPRHLTRAIETGGVSTVRGEMRDNTTVMGLVIPREVLNNRLADRVEKMFADGLENEVRGLVDQFGWSAPGLQSLGYREFKKYLSGESSIEQIEAQILRSHKQLAKRQRTWFRRNKSIHWISNKEEAVDLVTTLLNK